jgi:hypothetical protein
MEDDFNWHDVLIVADYYWLIRMIPRPLFVVQHFDIKSPFYCLKMKYKYFQIFVILNVSVKKKKMS